jgi:4-hydroxythreonine-4-phosphate dehydrogenase
MTAAAHDRNTGMIDNAARPLALTMGDPAGIGPEIALKALTSGDLPPDCRIIVIGDLSVLEQAAGFVGRPARIHAVSSAAEHRDGFVNVLDMRCITPADFTMGVVSAKCGKAAYAYILKAIELAKAGLVAGAVTNPINKEALRAAGIDYPGHTEIFAHETGVTDYSMVFQLDAVAVAHVTTHCSVRQALDLITTDRVVRMARLLDATLRRMLDGRAPAIAVGGLNPHAGENGLFGDEEISRIIPAVKLARAEGMNVSGPFPPDTVFMRAFKGEFDGVVAMLHDHGFVALKSRDFENGVNITVGLPIVRTSVGHGTAFDIAGAGAASEKSLLAAIRTAQKLSARR